MNANENPLLLENNMLSENHPDVKLFHDYENSIDTIHVRIVTILTDDFPYGLCLEERFNGLNAEADAEKMAVKTQKWVDAIRKTKRS